MKNDLSVWKLLFDKVPEAICILHDQQIIEINDAFTSLTGYSRGDIGTALKKLEEISYPKDFKNIARRLKAMDETQHLRDELRILAKDRNVKEVDVAFQHFVYKGKPCFLCTLHDIGMYKDREEAYKNRAEMEHQKVLETAQHVLETSKQIAHVQELLEKIHRISPFFREIWQCETENALLEKALRMMIAHPDGFQYASASIFLIHGDYLQLAFSTHGCVLQRFHLKKQHKLAQVARGEKDVIDCEHGEYVMPIRSPIGIFGVLQVFLEEQDRLVIAATPTLQKAYRDLLEITGNILGILISKFRSKKYEAQYPFDTSLLQTPSCLFERLAKLGQEKIPFVFAFLHWSPQESVKQEQDAPTHKTEALALKIVRDCSDRETIVTKTDEETFCILLPETSALSETINWAKQIKSVFKKKLPTYTISMGLAQYSSGNNFPGAICELSALCLCKAKDHKGGIYYWDETHQCAKEILDKIGTKLM